MRKKTRTKILNIRLSEWEEQELNKAINITKQTKTSFVAMAILEKVQRITGGTSLKNIDKYL